MTTGRKPTVTQKKIKNSVCWLTQWRICNRSLFQKPRITLTQWSLEKIGKSNDGEVKRSTITMKKTVMTTEDALALEFHDRLFRFRRDIFNIRGQYRAYRQLREHLRNNECLLHVYFSEKYTCKYSQEIQPVHFGGSHQQATNQATTYWSTVHCSWAVTSNFLLYLTFQAAWAPCYMGPPWPCVRHGEGKIPSYQSPPCFQQWSSYTIQTKGHLLPALKKAIQKRFQRHQLELLWGQPQKGGSRWCWGYS